QGGSGMASLQWVSVGVRGGGPPPSSRTWVSERTQFVLQLLDVTIQFCHTTAHPGKLVGRCQLLDLIRALLCGMRIKVRRQSLETVSTAADLFSIARLQSLANLLDEFGGIAEEKAGQAAEQLLTPAKPLECRLIIDEACRRWPP